MVVIDQELIGDICGWAGGALSIYFFFSPIFQFRKILKDKMKYSDYPGFLLVCNFFNCILWFDYGLIKNKKQMWGTNAGGAALTLIWLTIYFIYASKKRFFLSFALVLFLITSVLGISIVFFYIFEIDTTKWVVLAFNVLMYAAPGEKIMRVLKTGHYELIPIATSIGVLLSSLLWGTYGFYIRDWIVMIPNSLGILFGIFQIAMYIHFYCKSKKEDEQFEGETDDDMI